jgi:hypothetical protein
MAEFTLLSFKEAGPMWAVVITVDINDLAKAKRSLDEELVPMVRQQAGFVGGYWIHLDGDHGTSVSRGWSTGVVTGSHDHRHRVR